MNATALRHYLITALVVGATAIAFNNCTRASNTSAKTDTSAAKAECAYPKAPTASHAEVLSYDAAAVNSCDSNPGGVEGWTGLDLTVAKLSLPDSLFAGGAGCGTCYVVKGSKGSVVGRALEHCNGCDGIRIDEVSLKAVSGGTARAEVSLQAVACPVGNEGVRVTMMAGSDPYLFKVNVTNTRHPVRKVEIDAGSGFVEMNRAETSTFSYNFGRAQSAVADVRVTDAWGETLTIQTPTNVGHSTLSKQQFPECK